MNLEVVNQVGNVETFDPGAELGYKLVSSHLISRIINAIQDDGLH